MIFNARRNSQNLDTLTPMLHGAFSLIQNLRQLVAIIETQQTPSQADGAAIFTRWTNHLSKPRGAG